MASIWALSYRWEDGFAYALESLSANRTLFEKYAALARNPPLSPEEAEQLFNLIKVEDQARSSLDEQQGISGEEERMGMRAALRQLEKPCAGCGEVPISLSPSDCDVCGKFKMRRIQQ